MVHLKQSTAYTFRVGPFLDETDGKTAETTLTITQPDIRLSKAGGDFAQRNAAGTLTHDESGWYILVLDTTDLNTVGSLIVAIHESGALPVWVEFQVLEEATYDFLYASGATPILDINAEADTALSDYDPPTKAEMDTAHALLATPAQVATELGTYDSPTKAEMDTAHALLATPAQVATELGTYDGPTKAEMDTGHGLLATEAKQDIIDTVVDAIKAVTDLLPDAGALSDLATILADTNELQTDDIPGLLAILDAGVLNNTTIATLASQVSFTLTAGSADDGAYVGMLAVIEDVSTAVQKCIGIISAYTGSTKTVTLREDPGVFTMVATDKIAIVAISPDTLNILADTNELQADDYPTSIAAIQTDVDDIQTRLPAALSNGSIDANVERWRDGVPLVLATGLVQTIMNSLTGAALDAIVDQVWDEAIGGHVVDQSFGAHLQGTVVRADQAQAGGASTITLDTSASATDDLYNGLYVTVYSGTGAGQTRQITDYVGSSKVATVDSAWTTNPASGSRFVLSAGIAGSTPPTAVAIADQVWDEAKSGHVGAGSTGEEIQSHALTSEVAAVETDTQDIQGRLPAALVSGAIDSSVKEVQAGGLNGAIGTGSFTAGAINAAAIAADAITAAKIAANALTSAKFATGAINAAAIAVDAIGASELAADAINEIADQVWDELRSGHVAAGSIGQAVQSPVIRDGTAQAGAASTITLDASASATDDIFNDDLVVIISGTGVGQTRLVTDYVGSSKIATISPAWQTNPDATSVFIVLALGEVAGASAPSAASVADAVWDEQVSDHQAQGSASAAVTMTAYMGPYGPGVYLDDGAANTGTTLGDDGTLENPVSTIAAATTIAVALGAKRIYLINNTEITLAQTYEDYQFIGIGLSNQVTLGSQDVDNSEFVNVTLTGTQGGTQFMRARDCRLQAILSAEIIATGCQHTGSVTMRAATNQSFDQCVSATPGGGTPDLVFPGSGTTTVNFRHYSGGLTVKSAGATDVMSYEADGQLVIDATCTSLTVHVRGNCTITDNGTTTALTEDAALSRPTIADDIWDEAKAGHVAGGSMGEEVQAHATPGEVATELGTYDGPTSAELVTEIDSVQTDIAALNDLSAAQVNAEVDAAIVTYGLDHLLAAAVAGADVIDNSVIARLVSASATADWDDYVNTTDALQALRDRGDAAWVTGAGAANPYVLSNTTIATLASQTSFTLSAGSADDDAYNGMLAIVEDTSTSTQKCVGVISDYVGATKTVTLREDPGVFAMVAGDTIDVVVASPDVLNILADTNELQSDDVPTLIAAVQSDTDDIQTRLPAALVSGRMDASVGAMAANVLTAAALATDAVNELVDQVWDEAQSGHVGAGSMGEMATEIASILADTGTDGVAIATATAQSIADEILKRDIDNVEVAAAKHSLCVAILKSVSKVEDDAGTLKVYLTDGTTLKLSQTVATDAANDPIDSLTVGV